ncbi:MAG: META domain-containing protein [Pseudomonadota bacterium]
MARFSVIAALLASGVLAACQGDETISSMVTPEEVFALTEFDGAAPPASATLSFPASGQVAGSGPCNRFSATQAAPLPWVEIGPIVATKRACAALSFESAFFAAITQATLIERTGNLIILTGGGPDLVFRLR